VTFDTAADGDEEEQVFCRSGRPLSFDQRHPYAGAMRAGTPSRSALLAARQRAAHQLLEQGRIFSDPLALRILGQDAHEIVHREREGPHRRALRLYIAARARFAEDALSEAVERGVRQIVVLGAGLDTFAYRSTYRELKVFEVDHPATQAWKRECLANAAIDVPSTLAFVPIDFERVSLAEGLATAGFDASTPTFFAWLGVVVYLTGESVAATLRYVANLPACSHVVFDYANPAAQPPPGQVDSSAVLADRMAARGEAWINHLDTVQLHAQLRALGFSELEDLGPAQIVARYFPDLGLPVPDRGAHLLRAAAVNRPRS